MPYLLFSLSQLGTIILYITLFVLCCCCWCVYCVNSSTLNTLCPVSQIMSLHLRYISFLWQVADLGCNLNMPLLRDGARVLMKLMPPGIHAPVLSL